MKNMGAFTTENGVASLVLEEIPYKKIAYVRVQSALEREKLLRECVDFCIAVGAEKVVGTGCAEAYAYPHDTDLLKMSAFCEEVGTTEACVFPVTEKTCSHWRELYNRKMERVANSAFMTIAKSEAYIKENEVYFVHKDGVLLGCGSVGDGIIDSVFSLVPGGGREVVRALCGVIDRECVTLTVASTNEKARKLYEELGFIVTEVLTSWHILYEKDRA